MSTFKINDQFKANNNNKSAVKPLPSNFSGINIRSPNTLATLKTLPSNRVLLPDGSGVTAPALGSKIRSKQDSKIISVNNNAKFITIRKDTTPIRNNLYHYYLDDFKQPITVDKFQFCFDQKVSSVFSSSGDSQWFTTLIKNQPSFKLPLFGKITPSLLSLNADCSCIYTNFSGLYTLDTKLINNQLIASSNRNVSKGAIDFNIESNYISIYIYSNKTKSYVNIRLRPPLRYRPAYNDWVFDEDVNIFDTLSDTEYAKLINCCGLEDPKTL